MKPWFKTRALADNPRRAHVVIDRPIGSDYAPDWIKDFVSERPARDFIAAVDALGELDDIDLEINTPGGDVARAYFQLSEKPLRQGSRPRHGAGCKHRGRDHAGG